MENVLVLAIEYAPYQTTGAFRTMYFTKYLRQFGINPIVVTISPEKSNENYSKLYNPDLNKLTDDNITVYRTRLKNYINSSNSMIRNLKMFFKVNDRLGRCWEESLTEELPAIVNKHAPKLIYVSCPPFSTAKLGAKFSEKFGLPLVLDMRDSWSHWCVSPFASYFHFYFTLLSERLAFNKAVKIITVTEQLKQIFLKAQPQIESSKISVIPNGFDIKLNYSKPLEFKGIKERDKKIIISYVGSFYYEPQAHKDMFAKWYEKKNHKIFQYTPQIENWLYRSPYFFLLTLSSLFKQNPTLKNKIEFHHFGRKIDWLRDMIIELNLEDNFKARGYLNHEELQNEIELSDLFLCTSIKVIDGEDFAIASKTFEYISAHKPVLGFVTKGSQLNFLEQSNCGVIFNPDDIQESTEKLGELIENGVSLTLNESYLKKFERENTARDLAELLEKIR